MKTQNKRAVIAGGGVVGAWCAYYLNQSGWDVTIVEKNKFGSGSSHGNCGYLCPSHALPLAQPGAIWNSLKTFLHKDSALKIRVGQAFAKMGWFLNFVRRCNYRDMLQSAEGVSRLLSHSRKLYDQEIAKAGIDCDLQSTGILFVFQSQNVFEHFSKVNDLVSARFDQPAKKLNAKELEEIEPSLKPGASAGAWLYENDATLRPDSLMLELSRVLKQSGVKIIENCEVKSLKIENRQVTQVVTNQQTIDCDAIVFATGAWTPKLNSMLGCNVPIIPGKGYSITMSRPEYCPKRSIIFEEHHVAITPFRDGYRIGSTMEFAGYDDSINKDRLGILRRGAEHYLKTPFGETVQEEWWGWRPMTYDGNPIIDFAPCAKNALIAAGHGMLGLSMGTGTGELVSQMINQQTSELNQSHYSLRRF